MPLSSFIFSLSHSHSFHSLLFCRMPPKGSVKCQNCIGAVVRALAHRSRADQELLRLATLMNNNNNKPEHRCKSTSSAGRSTAATAAAAAAAARCMCVCVCLRLLFFFCLFACACAAPSIACVNHAVARTCARLFAAGTAPTKATRAPRQVSVAAQPRAPSSISFSSFIAH